MMHALQVIVDVLTGVFHNADSDSVPNMAESSEPHAEPVHRGGRGGNLAAVMDVISKAIGLCDVKEINAGVYVLVASAMFIFGCTQQHYFVYYIQNIVSS